MFNKKLFRKNLEKYLNSVHSVFERKFCINAQFLGHLNLNAKFYEKNIKFLANFQKSKNLVYLLLLICYF